MYRYTTGSRYCCCLYVGCHWTKMSLNEC